MKNVTSLAMAAFVASGLFLAVPAMAETAGKGAPAQPEAKKIEQSLDKKAEGKDAVVEAGKEATTEEAVKDEKGTMAAEKTEKAMTKKNKENVKAVPETGPTATGK